MKKLKDYSIKTKIILQEHRERYTDGKGLYEQPFKFYSFEISNSSGRTMCGGIKTKRQLIKDLAREIQWL